MEHHATLDVSKQIINRGKCSIISASDDWYYFLIEILDW
jgi:hypothetical protein